MKDKDKFAWGQVDIRSRSTEQSIVGENLLSDENSEVIRDENKTLAKEFEALYRTERIDFEAFFARSGDERPSFGRHCALALKNGGPGWELATGLVKQATGDVVSERDVRDIMNRCPPVRAFFVALLWSYHRKCVLYARRKTVGNAGRDDLLSAVYLPYCDVFVTDDHGQYEALTEIAAETQISSLVQMYEAFSQSLLGVSA